MTRDQIVAAALRLVDRDGLEALSMRNLAREVGAGVMSLYYHVEDKSALYDLVLDAILGGIDLTIADSDAPATERIERMARAYRTALLEHPHAASLVAQRPLRTPTQLRPIEVMLGVLLDAGLSPCNALQAVNVLGQFVIGTTTMYVNHLIDSEYHDDRISPDPTEFPNLISVFSSTPGPDWDADFDAGLAALVDRLVGCSVEGKSRFRSE